MEREPVVIGFIGNSNSGKTTLITRLANDLVQRGYTVGTAKNCAHGFDLGSQEKDSWQLLGSGSRATLLTSPSQSVLLRAASADTYQDVVSTLGRLFAGFDIVLAEGYKTAGGMQRIALLADSSELTTLGAIAGVIALVSDQVVDAGMPVFRRDSIDDIASFLEQMLLKKVAQPSVQLYINGTRLRLKSFVKDMIRGVLLGLLVGLKREDDDSPIRDIVVKVVNQE